MFFAVAFFAFYGVIIFLFGFFVAERAEQKQIEYHPQGGNAHERINYSFNDYARRRQPENRR